MVKGKYLAQEKFVLLTIPDYFQLVDMTKLYKTYDRLPFAPGPWSRPAPPPLEEHPPPAPQAPPVAQAQPNAQLLQEVQARVKFHQDMHLRLQQLTMLQQQATEANDHALLQVRKRWMGCRLSFQFYCQTWYQALC